MEAICEIAFQICSLGHRRVMNKLDLINKNIHKLRVAVAQN